MLTRLVYAVLEIRPTELQPHPLEYSLLITSRLDEGAGLVPGARRLVPGATGPLPNLPLYAQPSVYPSFPLTAELRQTLARGLPVTWAPQKQTWPGQAVLRDPGGRCHGTHPQCLGLFTKGVGDIRVHK